MDNSKKITSRVSVIITTCDRPETLPGAIQSALDQTYKDLEIIVVNNGKPSEFRNPRVRHIQTSYDPKEYASTKNLNVGIRASIGKYIAILDDDDWWTDVKKIEKQVKFLEEHPDYAAVGTNEHADLYDIYGDIIMSKSTNVPLDDATLRENALLSQPIAHSTALYRHLLYYDENLKRSKDWDMFLRLGILGKLANLPDCTVIWSDVRSIKKRREDAYWSARVIWKYRNEYPHFLKAISIILFRLIVFSVLSLWKPKPKL